MVERSDAEHAELVIERETAFLTELHNLVREYTDPRILSGIQVCGLLDMTKQMILDHVLESSNFEGETH